MKDFKRSSFGILFIDFGNRLLCCVGRSIENGNETETEIFFLNRINRKLTPKELTGQKGM